MHLNTSWRRIKDELLAHTHKPPVDFIIWVLLDQVAKYFGQKLNNRLR